MTPNLKQQQQKRNCKKKYKNVLKKFEFTKKIQNVNYEVVQNFYTFYIKIPDSTENQF